MRHKNLGLHCLLCGRSFRALRPGKMLSCSAWCAEWGISPPGDLTLYFSKSKRFNLFQNFTIVCLLQKKYCLQATVANNKQRETTEVEASSAQAEPALTRRNSSLRKPPGAQAPIPMSQLTTQAAALAQSLSTPPSLSPSPSNTSSAPASDLCTLRVFSKAPHVCVRRMNEHWHNKEHTIPRTNHKTGTNSSQMVQGGSLFTERDPGDPCITVMRNDPRIHKWPSRTTVNSEHPTHGGESGHGQLDSCCPKLVPFCPFLQNQGAIGPAFPPTVTNVFNG